MRLRAVRRPGLSLLEVIVAMAVFLFSLISLGHLMNASAALAMASAWARRKRRFRRSGASRLRVQRRNL